MPARVRYSAWISLAPVAGAAVVSDVSKSCPSAFTTPDATPAGSTLPVFLSDAGVGRPERLFDSPFGLVAMGSVRLIAEKSSVRWPGGASAAANPKPTPITPQDARSQIL